MIQDCDDEMTTTAARIKSVKWMIRAIDEHWNTGELWKWTMTFHFIQWLVWDPRDFSQVATAQVNWNYQSTKKFSWSLSLDYKILSLFPSKRKKIIKTGGISQGQGHKVKVKNIIGQLSKNVIPVLFNVSPHNHQIF